MNPIMGMNPQMFMQQFQTFMQQFKQGNANPQQMVQNLLNQGKMSQEQFNQLRNMANQITGMKM